MMCLFSVALSWLKLVYFSSSIRLFQYRHKNRYRTKYINKKTHTPEVIRILKYCAYSERNIKYLLESYMKGIYKTEIDEWEIWNSNEFVDD